MALFRRYYSNGAPQQQISGSVLASQTTVQCPSFAGYPTSFPFYAAFDVDLPTVEVVLVTNIVGTTATITRGQDGTSAIDHLAGSTFDATVVAADMDEANAHHLASVGVHGIAGSVVGTTDAQTLSNKLLTSAKIDTGGLDLQSTKLLNVGAATAATDGVNKTYVDSAVASSTPAGVITAYAGTTAPAGYLLCDGSSQLRSTYPALFTAIGTTYGSVDGTHFTLPNLLGRFIAGYTSGVFEFNTLGKTGGATEHVHSIDQHSHVLSDLGQAAVFLASSAPQIGMRRITSANWGETVNTTASPAVASTRTVSGGAALVGQTDNYPESAVPGVNTGLTEGLPPYLTLNYLIKY